MRLILLAIAVAWLGTAAANETTVKIVNDFAGTTCLPSDTDQLKCAICLGYNEYMNRNGKDEAKAREMIIRTLITRAQYLHHRSLCETLWKTHDVFPMRRLKLPSSDKMNFAVQDAVAALAAGPTAESCAYHYDQDTSKGPDDFGGRTQGARYAGTSFYKCRPEDMHGAPNNTSEFPDAPGTAKEESKPK